MTSNSDATRGFLVDQVDRLENLGFVTVGSPTSPFVVLEIFRSESGDLETRVPPRFPSAPLTPATRSKLLDAGYVCEEPSSTHVPWVQSAATAADAVDLAAQTLRDIFEVELGEAVNLVHGSHRAEHEAIQRLEELRARIEPVLAVMLGQPPERDADGDYLFATDQVQVVIAPRAIPGAVAIVRVIAITNVGVNVTPELGLFLARLNFGLMFGRFALDTEHRSIWFDETLLGDEISDDQLRFTVNMVAETATEWAPKLQQMFGGLTHTDIEDAQRHAAPKPGAGGYL